MPSQSPLINCMCVELALPAVQTALVIPAQTDSRSGWSFVMPLSLANGSANIAFAGVFEREQFVPLALKMLKLGVATESVRAESLRMFSALLRDR